MSVFRIGFDGTKFVKYSASYEEREKLFDIGTATVVGLFEGYTEYENWIDERIDIYNKNLVKNFDKDSHSDSLIVRKCKECGRYYMVDREEALWYEERGLSLPKRCYECRRKRR